MNGPEGAAELIRGWLETAVPRRLAIIEARLPAGTPPVPRPALVAAEDRGPIGIEWWPAILCLPTITRRMDFVGADDAGEVYRVTYAMQVLAWVRGEDHPATSLLQRRYALAIREAILERKSLRATFGRPSDATIDPASIVEDYSAVTTGEGGATIAGLQVNVDLIVAELVPGPAPVGRADTLTVAAVPHPALA